MEEISEKNTIYLDSYVDTEHFDVYGRKTFYNIFLKSGNLLNQKFTIILN